MTFKVRAKREAAGRYRLEYGRGKQKLTDTVWNNEVAGGWQVDYESDKPHPVNEDAPYEKLRDLKEAWGQWASTQYDAGDEGTPSPKADETAKPKGPPSFKRSGPPSFKRKAGGPPSIKSKTKSPIECTPPKRLQEVMAYVTEKLEQEPADYRDARTSLVATAYHLKELADAYVEAEQRRLRGKADAGDPPDWSAEG